MAPRKSVTTTTSNKSELTLLLKSIDRRMQDFEEAVQDLKDIKEGISSMETDIEKKQSANDEVIKELNRNLELNVLKTLQEKANSIGKVIISQEELHELKNEYNLLKNKHANYVKDTEAIITKKITEKVEQARKFIQLEYERENAKLSAELESYKTNIESQKNLMDRMSKELDSQKILTAEIAKSSSRQGWSQSEK